MTNFSRSFSIGESKGGLHETYKKQLIIWDCVCRESFTDSPKANSKCRKWKNCLYIGPWRKYRDLHHNDNGKNLRRLTDHPEVDFYPAWLPDGHHIAFSSNRDRDFSVYTMDLAGKNIKRIVDSGDRPVISPDGQWIAVSHVRGRLQRGPSLLFVDIEGLMQREILLQAPVGFYGMIDWSPDGKRLAFTIRIPGILNDIYVVDIAGKNLRQLTEDPAQDLYPAWSPDGQWIAFWSNRDGGNAIYLMDADGANPKRLADGRSPEWSPDGQQIAFVSRQEGIEGIFIMDRDGGNIRLLIEDGDNPAWFGSKLAVSDAEKWITLWGQMKRESILAFSD